MAILSTVLKSVMRALRSHSKLTIAAIALFLLYTGLGFFWIPQLISREATAYVQNSLHRNLTLGQVKFNPFTLTLRVYQAQLAETTGEPIAGFDYLLVNAEFSSLVTGTYHLKAIELSAPAIQAIINNQGKLNLDLSDPNTPKSDGNEPLPAVRIDEFRLSSGKVHFEDHTKPTPFSTDFAPIQFVLRDFRTQPGHENAFHFSGASEDAETFDWQGDFTVQPLASNGQLQLGNLKATTVQDYLQDALPFRLLNGSIDLQGNYQLTLNDQTELKLSLPSVQVSNAQVAPKEGAVTPWVTLGKLILNNTQVSLQQRTVNIDQVRIEDALLNTWFDKNYNLNLLALLGPNEPSGDKPWTSSVKQIEMVNAHVPVEDRSLSRAATFDLNPVQATVRNFSTAPNATIEVSAQLRVNDQSDVAANGTIKLDTLLSQLHVQLKQFPLKAMQAYADAATDVQINSGTISAEGDVQYKGKAKGEARNKTPELQFTGNVEVANLDTQDTVDNKDFIDWQSVRLEQMTYTMAPDTLEVARIVARKPYGRVIIEADGSTNIQHVLRRKPAEKSAGKPTDAQTVASKSTKGSDAAAMRTRINEVKIDDGTADFTDNTVQPIFSTGIQRLNGSITGLSSANGSRAKVKLDGSVDNYAPVSISGEANFLAADTYSDISMNFSNMELTTFNPYSGKFAGYSIAKGKLSTDLHYQITDRKLNAQHHIVVDQLEFGAATDSKDAVPLPIKLAVALLKDRNGVIDLELPVSGSIDDPQFKLGPIVWKACVNLLTKIVTAPFAALGKLFGGGEELSYVDFMPGSAVLSSTEADKLNKLAKGMIERPELKLNIPLTAITDADAAAMNAARYQQAVNAVLLDATTATPPQLLNVLTTLYQRKLKAAPTFPPAPQANTDDTAERIAYLEQQLKPLYAISAADRDILTRARADAVQAALLANTELSPERVFLTARSNEATSPDGVVRMGLKLE
jgi:hypothetical protein